MTVLLDAGPALNFLAVSQQDVLIKVANRLGTKLHVPERVEMEILGKADSDARFQRTPAAATWRKLRAGGHVVVLPDTLTGALLLEQAIARISNQPARSRVNQSRNLGEIMVIAHGSVLVQGGADVRILMDESQGRGQAATECRWLAQQGCTGTMEVWSTEQVLRSAQAHKMIPRWETIYDTMRPFDDGLTPRK